ncbi:helix-turn-helix domain-containing protein [Actinokineospora guangxiensis]|uniref:helix-turn-helix domain-containing protein n=1 Tax=Actinokineospora guangxiensis TaxID=1490288 RepID=UPI00366C2081
MALSPAVARRMLCFDLEQLMGTAGVTHQALAECFGVSRPAVTAAMQGKTLFSRPAVEVICKRLEREEWLPRLEGLLATARRTPGMPKPQPGPRNVGLLVGLEAYADNVTIFDPWLVPVLLQNQM